MPVSAGIGRFKPATHLPASPSIPVVIVSILKPRTRIVYFRVSEEDFLRLTDLCPRHGARSISELVRSAVQEMLHETPSPADDGRAVVERLEALDKTISEMNRNLKRLMPKGRGDNGNTNA
jgi:hypothetical protein